MKAKEVTRLLNCTHTTLHNYVKSGQLKLNKILPNGYYDYNKKSVLALMSKLYSKDTSNCVIIITNGNKFTFEVEKDTINKILEIIKQSQSDFPL